MKNFLLNLLDLIYKKRCYFCKSSKENVTMCSKCYEELKFNDNLPIREFEGVEIFCAGVYEKNIQKLIRGVKYHRQLELAYFQAKFMSEYFSKLNLNKSFIIIPVPLFANREKRRGYNHMDIVGIELSKQIDLNINTQLIKRIKDTKPQYKLKKYERIENLRNAFQIDKSMLNKNCDILIIDDIYTTGSTFESMIKVLKESGFHNITCFATVTAR